MSLRGEDGEFERIETLRGEDSGLGFGRRWTTWWDGFVRE